MRGVQVYDTTDRDRLRGLTRIAGIVGIAAAVLAVVGYFISGAELFFQAYLFSYVFWLGIAMGLLGLLLLHFLMDTRWGLTIRRVAEAGAGSLWIFVPLFIPILLGLPVLFEWARPEAVAESEVLQFKTFYLNVPFFIVRAVAYFAIWLLVAFTANRLSARLSAAADPAAVAVIRGRLRALGAFGLILYILTMSFASIDWLMSVEPFWNSSIYGLIIIIGQGLTALAFAVAVINLLPGLGLGRGWHHDVTPIPYGDLGALMFTFVFGWAYLAYFQLLIIWSANIPREVVWYLNRTQGGWSAVAIFIALFQFVLPFMILLTARVRRNMRRLGIIGVALVFTFLVTIFWHVKPAFSPGAFSISWLDIVMPVAIGGIFLAVFLTVLARRPALTAVEEAYLAPAENHEHAV